MKKEKELKKNYRKSLIKNFINSLPFIKNKNKRLEKYLLNNNLAPDISSITKNIAFIIDDEVVEIIHCQEKMAAILLSNPQIVDIEKGVFPKIGWKYKDGIFTSKEDK